MGSIKKIVIAIFTFSFLIFVVLFGQVPALRRGRIGILSRFIRVKLPNLLIQLDECYTGGRLFSYLSTSFDYLKNRNHPLILAFYMILLVASETLFLRSTFSKLSPAHRVTAICLSLSPIFFTYKAVTSTSSTITKKNHEQGMRSYPYDHVLYRPGQLCRTCNFFKPARSKHCSVCNVCVAKHDHHCVWIMNCVGKGNISHFLFMLLSLSFVLTYGAYLSYVLLNQELQKSANGRLIETVKNQHWSRGLTWSQYASFWSWALGLDFRIGGVGLLALLTAPLAWTMFLYHIYLIWAGTTTNESSKWLEWREYVDRGLVYKWTGDTDGISEMHADPSVEPFVEWPIHSNQRLFRSEDGQHPDATSSQNGAPASPSRPRADLGMSFWKPVYGLHEIDNLYDLGFWDNLKDVLRPV